MKGINKFMACAAASLMAVSMGTVMACGTKETVTVTGSSSVSPLMQVLASSFEKQHSNIRIRITTSDSTTGVTDAINSRNDIGMVSRSLKASETGLTTTKLCDDGIALIVNKNALGIENATSDEVYNLYAFGTAIGSITTAISREEGSGTRGAFDELIKNVDGNALKNLTALSNKVDIANSTGLVKSEIATSAAISKMGYVSMGALDATVKTIAFGGVQPSSANVKNGTYRLARPFLLVQKVNTSNAKAKAFLDYVLSQAGQKVVTDSGYIAL